MNERAFEMRLTCRYADSENQIADLEVESLEDGEWRTLDLNTRSPGFQVFTYAIFTCQHTYFRTNCAEHGLILDRSTGSLNIVTDESWVLQSVRVRFDAKLQSGIPKAEIVEFIVERMKQCPVSVNVKDIPVSETVVHFD